MTAFADLYQDTMDTAAGRPIPHMRSEGKRYVDIPSFYHGQITPRHCTSQYKIHPIHRAVRAWAGERPPRLHVLQYMGISTDEAHRMKDSRLQYITHAYPLVDAGLTRADCRDYLATHHPGHPVGKSACFFARTTGRPSGGRWLLATRSSPSARRTWTTPCGSRWASP